MSIHNQWFEQKYETYYIFLSENFRCLVVKFSVYLNRNVFVIVDKDNAKKTEALCYKYKQLTTCQSKGFPLKNIEDRKF